MSIKVKNLVKAFDKKTIIDNISFDVNDGEILSIIGFSGSGKSTVLKLISGLIEKDSGDIITSGGDIAMVFQNLLLLLRPTFWIFRQILSIISSAVPVRESEIHRC